MIKSELIKISDKSYHIQTFPARAGLNYLNKLKTMVGPALATMVSGEAAEDELSSEGLSEAIEKLINGMDDQDFEKMVIEIIEKYVLDSNSQPIIFDSEFAHRYDLVFSLMKEILNLNFGSLFLGHGDSDSPLKGLMGTLAN